MRYIISATQFHKFIYKYLDDMHSEGVVKKEINPYVEDGNTWVLFIYTDDDRTLLKYYWYGPGTDDDDNPHNGIGELYISRSLVEHLSTNLSVRKTKILDIVADWVSERYNVDIDNINIW